VPASSPDDPEVARRGLMVNAFAARELARDAAGVPALNAGGFNLRFARHDDEGAATNDDFPIEQIGAALATPSLVRYGGLPFGDADRWWIRLSQAGSVIPHAVLRVSVPNSTGPPAYLYNQGVPVPLTDADGFESHYDIQLRGCEWFDIKLSADRTFVPGSSPLRRADVLYRLNLYGFGSDAPSTEDSYDLFPSISPDNDEASRASNLSGSGWAAPSGAPTVLCSADSKTRLISNTTLHGCDDVDWYRINPWAGYDPTAASWGTLRAELEPRTAGVRLQFFEQVTTGATVSVEPAGPPGDGGATGVEINANAHPLPLLLKVDGATTSSFSIRLTFCIPSASFIGAAAGASSERSGRNGAFEFWEALREARLIRSLIPRDLGPDLTFDMAKFNWPVDMAGRSLQGQLFHITHTGGPLRLRAIPGGPDVSGRFDFSTVGGQHIAGIATADLEGFDGQQQGVSYHPQSAPINFETSSQQPGDYLLAISGFKLTDTWSLTLGAAQTLPGFPNFEGTAGQIPPVPASPPSMPRPISGAAALTGQRFSLCTIPAFDAKFNAVVGRPWRLEYSLDGQSWAEAGRAESPLFNGEAKIQALPPRGGFWRLRDIFSRSVISATATSATAFAAPTEAGRWYSDETSADLQFWLFGSPRPGDGSVILFYLPMFGDRNFLRVRRL
jgi:hypothetical protein